MIKNRENLASIKATVLFIGGIPVGYNIYCRDEVYLFHPVSNSLSGITAPVIIATQCDNKWEIEDITDQDLIDQVIEDLSFGSLSACYASSEVNCSM